MPSAIEKLQELLRPFPRLGLANLPTPLQPLRRLSAEAGGPAIWVKREDMTGVGFGGNKLRKLDFLLASSLPKGVDTLVSGGVVQSNSQRQVAAAAAKLGLGCHLAVFHGRLRAPTSDYHDTGNALLNRLFGATCHEVPWTGDRNAALQELGASLEAQGRNPFIVPYGVSSAAGAIGYASTAQEIAVQCRQEGFVPAAIVHCSGSGGTQAGLALGASVALPEVDVVGIDIDAEPDRVRADVLRYLHEAASMLGVESGDDASVEVVAGHAGPAYGVPHAETVDAIRLAGRTEALVLDPVYSGKGLAGLLALIRAGRWSAEDHVVFVHTGGEPALFAYRECLGI